MLRTCLGLVLGVALAAPVVGWAAEVEVRDYATTLDGQRVGDYRMTIAQLDDGSIKMSGQATMKLVTPTGPGNYAYRGTEVWKDGRLMRLDSQSGDDNQKTTVSAAADLKQTRVLVNGRERIVPGLAWTTTYWHLPPGHLRTAALTLLDADNGRDYAGKLEAVGVAQVVVGGQPVGCTRYRLTGGGQVDLWYDSHQRLVRQEWTQEGRKIVLELTRVKGQ